MSLLSPKQPLPHATRHTTPHHTAHAEDEQPSQPVSHHTHLRLQAPDVLDRLVAAHVAQHLGSQLQEAACMGAHRCENNEGCRRGRRLGYGLMSQRKGRVTKAEAGRGGGVGG